MGCTTIFRRAILVLACLGMLIQTPMVMAAATPHATAPATQAVSQAPNSKAKAAAPLIFDIGLQKGNTLVGQLVNAQGIPQAKQKVSLIQKQKVLVTSETDRNGYFAFTQVPAGTYQVAAPKAQGLCRVWAPKTAPPIAQSGLLLVDGKGAVRAQQGPIAYWLGKPWVIAGLVAAAVAIPVAIHNHQSNKHLASPY